MFKDTALSIFRDSISDYHTKNCVDAELNNPYEFGTIEYLLYKKNWIDTVQWHLEDIIRDPNIKAEDALVIKRRIDASNQDRTDLVEYIDSYFLTKFEDIVLKSGATINTESPAWAVDRLSILALKIYHMQEEANRENASMEHKETCQKKLNILLEQEVDLSTAIEQLLNNLESGNIYMKVYKQMKMYNDPALNPVLYGKK